MKTLVFLDIDGVLNCHEFDREVMCGQIHPDKVSRLNYLLSKTAAGIVLSSAWRYIIHRGEMNLVGMEWLLRSHGVLANRLVGITAPDTLAPSTYNGVPGDWPVENERGVQIHRWLGEHGHHPYVVLDDLDLGHTLADHPFVHVDGMVGLADADVGKALRLLGVYDHG